MIKDTKHQIAFNYCRECSNELNRYKLDEESMGAIAYPRVNIQFL